MRTDQEIVSAMEVLAEFDSVSRPPKADTFAYGMWCGKWIALGWVLGEESPDDLATAFDFAAYSQLEWERKVRMRAKLDQLDAKIKEEQPPAE